MNVVKFNPAFPTTRFSDLFENFFNRSLSEMFGNNVAYNVPSVNVKETDGMYELEVAAPGLEKEDFNVSVDNGYLTISAKREKSEETKDDNYTRREFNYTAFSRSFSLPENVNADNVAATYKNGILHITLPKREVAKVETGRVIEIK